MELEGLVPRTYTYLISYRDLNCSFHLSVGRPWNLLPFSLYWYSSFGNPFSSILSKCSSHFFWRVFILCFNTCYSQLFLNIPILITFTIRYSVLCYRSDETYFCRLRCKTSTLGKTSVAMVVKFRNNTRVPPYTVLHNIIAATLQQICAVALLFLLSRRTCV